MTKYEATDFSAALRDVAHALAAEIRREAQDRHADPLSFNVAIADWKTRLETLQLLCDLWEDRRQFEAEAAYQSREEQNANTF